jgi:putative FmdB family regulatory protein
MPIYEYQCKACGAALEKLQKISEPLLTDCPECGKPALVKQVSAPSFRLKGTGWYETDFKTGRKKLGTADGDDSREAGSKDSKNADEKASPAAGNGGETAAKDSAAASGKDNAAGKNAAQSSAPAGNQA